MIQSMEDEEHTNSLLPKYDYGNEDENEMKVVINTEKLTNIDTPKNERERKRKN